MRSVVSFITVVALALHLTLGCQWHHAHAAEEPAAGPITATCEHAHTGDAADHPEEPVSAPGETDDCETQDCVYVITGKVSVEASATSLPAALLRCPLLVRSDSSGETLAEHPEASAAVRPHLLFQVLLI